MTISIRLVRTLGLLAVLAFAVSGARPATAATKSFIAVLNGGQETPPNTSTAFGVAFLTFDGTQLCFSISYSNVSGETVAHIHGPAEPGVSGGILFPLDAGIRPKNGCWTTLDKAAKKALMKGRLYINIHSNDFPNGEIRGQIVRTTP